jgi:competence protein ComEC
MLPSAGTVRWLLMFLAVLATLLLACIVLMWRKLTHGANLPGWWNTGLCVFALCSGFLLASLRAEYRLADKLDAVDAGQVFRLDLRVATLPRQDAGRRAFVAEVLSSRPEGVPRRIQVSWLAPPDASGKAEGFPAIMPGQVWRMAVTIKPPWGPRNPHAFDYEGHLFAQDIRATGTVRGSPKLLRDDGWAGLSIAAQRARHYIREALLPHLEGMRYGAVLLALSIGDQASVAASDWQVFNRSGITHLVSISGSHVTMVAAMGGAVVFWFWRRLRWRGAGLSEWYPAQVVALVALLLAWLYCLLAGWGVPAQRTFLMLAMIALAYVIRLPVSSSRVVCLAAGVLVALDPWALLASGFWLSFGAVMILLASGRWVGESVDRQKPGRMLRLRRLLWNATRLQCAVSLALLPVLAMLFHEVSIVSPLANAYAIPVIGLAVTPVALLAAMCATVPGLTPLAGGLAWLGHILLQAMMAPTAWLAALPAASLPVAAAPWWLTLLALGGVAVATLPYGLPLRWAGWLLMLPIFLWRPERPELGNWTLHALDVGQAGAIVVRTAHHTLLFDTGARRGAHGDDGSRIIVPYLRAQGIHALDALVVSHADDDHAGGLLSVLQALPVSRAYSSFDLEDYVREHSASGTRRSLRSSDRLPDDAASERGHGRLRTGLPVLPGGILSCARGVRWEADGVAFEFLWPDPAEPVVPGRKAGQRRNDNSCVLRIQGMRHSALLTGDIGARQEAALVRAGLRHNDVVIAPHHGSSKSSSVQFAQATRPAHVIAQAGPWNRHGHPGAEVMARWRRVGAAFWRSDWHGAVTVESRGDALTVRSERQAARRYWTTVVGGR